MSANLIRLALAAVLLALTAGCAMFQSPLPRRDGWDTTGWKKEISRDDAALLCRCGTQPDRRCSRQEER
jgi:hypothetical protein